MSRGTESRRSESRREEQALFSPTGASIAGLLATAAAVLASGLGTAGTLLGAAVVAAAVTVLPAVRRARSSPRSAGKSAVAARALPTLAVSLLLSLATITSLEVGMSKSFSCRVWDECSTPRAAGAGETLYVSTEPSVLGGDAVAVESIQRGKMLASGEPPYGRS